MTSNASGLSLLIGEPEEPHLASVLERLFDARDSRSTGSEALNAVVVLNAANVSEVVIDLAPDRVVLRALDGQDVKLLHSSCAHGWIRRLAPPGWDEGVLLGSRQAATMSARLTLLAAVLRHPGVTWVTDIDRIIAAENKLVQYRVAHGLGYRVPRTSVGGDLKRHAQYLGDPFVVKPLGPGSFSDAQGEQHAVYARLVTCGGPVWDHAAVPDAISVEDLDAPVSLAGLPEHSFRQVPFIAQEVIEATSHLRVVTVGAQAWVTELDASDRPLDWRVDETAHDSFVETAMYPHVADAAVRIGQALGCGYTSQDWIVRSGEPFFIDLNPSGQWLFLPDPVGREVSEQLAQQVLGGASAAGFGG